MSPYNTIRVGSSDGVTTITLCRPEALNAVSMQMAREFLTAVLESDADPSARCIVITGEGKGFCAGGDVGGFVENAERISPYLKELTGYVHSAISRIARSSKPVVTAVNGVAAGAGFGLAMSGDLVIAAASARFATAYARIGAAPDASFTEVVPRIIGVRRTAELLFTDRTLSAGEALAWGLVTQVVDDSEFMAVVMKLARQLANGPTRAFGLTKRLLRGSLGELEAQMEREAHAIAESATTSDFREGVQAFIERRSPTFRGA